MRSYVPHRAHETTRNMLVTKPGLNAQERAAADKLYMGWWNRIIPAMYGLCAFYLVPVLIDTFIYNPNYLDWMDQALWLALIGVVLGLAVSEYRVRKLKAQVSKNDYVGVKIQLTQQQLALFHALENRFVLDSAQHEQVWAWAKSVKRHRRVAVADSLLTPESAAA